MSTKEGSPHAVVEMSRQSRILNESVPRLSEDAWHDFRKAIEAPATEPPPPKLIERLKRAAPWDRDAHHMIRSKGGKC